MLDGVGVCAALKPLDRSMTVSPALALNQDGTANSSANAAPRGSIIVLYITGGGNTNPAGVDGQIATNDPALAAVAVSVFVDGAPARVTNAGDGPGLVEGVMQINFIIPDNANPGALTVAIAIGDARSQTGVTIQVK
jgi:uncharacterized protein (TIGR03437 family)